MPDPALAEALAAVGLLTLGGVVVLPRAAVCVGAGAALGWAAFGPLMLGSALGAALGFGLARFVLAGPIRRFAARRPRADAMMRAVDAEGWRALALLRLGSPVPGAAINLACGASRMGFGAFLAVSVLGVVPQTLLFVHLGRAGGGALAGRSLLGPDGLAAALGAALTLLALWRLKAAAGRQAARILAEAAP